MTRTGSLAHNRPVLALVGGLRAPALATVEVLAPPRDLGRINPRHAVQFSFRLINRGTSPVLISKVMTEIGCTVTGIDSQSFWLEPGRIKKVLFAYDPKGAYGFFQKAIRFTTNVPGTAPMSAHFTGYGARPVECSSGSVTLDASNRRDLAIATVQVQYTDPDKVPEETVMASDSSWLTAHWIALDKDAGTGTIQVIVDPRGIAADVSTASGQIMFYTGSPARQAIPIQVHWVHSGPSTAGTR